MAKEKGINWNDKAKILWDHLISLAKRSRTTTYGDIAPLIGYSRASARPVRFALGPIQDFCQKNRIPKLTAVVVNQGTNEPGSGFMGGDINDVYDFDWDSISNPFDVGADQVDSDGINHQNFLNFIYGLDGKTLETLSQKKVFRIGTDSKNVIFTPQSGKPRPIDRKDIKLYLEFYNQGARRPSEFHEKSRNASYFLAVIREYQQPNETLHYQKGGVPNKSTEAENITLTRIGQGKFRKRLLEYWKNNCAVTNLGEAELLRASHIKPWKFSDDRERLDKYNGLLLSPNLDALFDGGWITFDDSGKIKISTTTKKHEKALRINSDMRLKKIENAHRPYLDYHRSKIFRK